MKQPLNLLIVEDSAADAEMMIAALRQGGFDPRARTVATELDYLAALGEPPDLILGDYSLPGFNGLRALELLASRKLDIPFILVSGTIGEDLAVEALQRGAADYLLKDRLGRLAAAVERALELHRAREERRRSDREIRWLAAIVENSSDAIIGRSLDGSITSWNAGAERAFGYTAEEAIGKSLDLIKADDRDGRRMLDNNQALHGGETVQPFETLRRTKDGRVVEFSVGLSPIRDHTGKLTGVAVINRDISALKKAEAERAYLSQHDPLTGLPNRSLLRDRLELAVARARRRREVLGILLLNLDRFKKINESLGRDAGDELLRDIAARLQDTLREADTIARLGGNEYAVLVEGAAGADDVIAVAEKVVHALTEPFDVRGMEVVVSASIGVVVYRDGTSDAVSLLENAEVAMSRAKADGGGGYQLYQGEPVAPRGKRFTVETRLRRALENGELGLHYQPKVNLATGTITGAEALLRWNSPELGPVSPAELIPIAEETGLIVPIGAWVLETACAQAARWRGQDHDLSIAVNLSPRQFRQKGLVSMVTGILLRTGLAAQHLELEITEGTAMSNAEQTVAVLNELHGLGVKLAVDDFGTGYSSLSYLKRFPLHCLKIDRAFVSDAPRDANGASIVQATVALAHSLHLKVVAEGIETEAQRDFLRLVACDEGQGYLFSKPMPVVEFDALMQASAGSPGRAQFTGRRTLSPSS